VKQLLFMRRLLFFYLFMLFSTAVFSQTISGSVKDSKGNPVSGANVTIRDSYDGAMTDSTGHYRFTTTDKGEKILQFTAIGYKPVEQQISIGTANIKADAILKEEITELKAVVITAGSFEASDKKKTTVLNSIDIVTTASANADVTAAVKTLPGAQQVGESEGLFVRGGTAAETKIFIDGNLVNNFFYTGTPNIASRGRFSPFIFKGTIFSAGGYSALYGQALSSALILETIDLPDQSSASVALSFIGVGGGYQHLAKKKNASWGFSYDYTNLTLAFKVLKQKPEYFTIPEYHDGDANFRIKTSKTGMLKYYGYFSVNQVGLRNASIDTPGFKDVYHLRNFNIYNNIAYKENLGNKWKMLLGLSYTNNRDNIKGSTEDAKNETVLIPGFEYKNFRLKTTGNYFNAKAVFEYRMRALSALRIGTEYNQSSDEISYTTYNGMQYPGKLNENIHSVFGEADIYLTNSLAARGGIRAEHSTLLEKFNLAPRLSLAYKLGAESQASVAYGIFYQGPDKRYLPSVTDLDFARATHYIAQYQKLHGKTTFRAEVYYKKYNSLVKTGIVAGKEAAVNNNGYGEAKGFELFWRDKQTFKNFDYWISYSFLDTKRDFNNFPKAIQPNFAAKHTASLVTKRFVTNLKTQFNFSYTYASGRPYYHITYDHSNNKFSITDQGKTIDYNSLSFSVNYLPNVFKKGATKFNVFVFSITNMLGSKQVYGYNYSYNGARKEAIEPPTRTFIYLGAFFSFGIDRTQEAIDSKL
jgi:vitamin B12 transporter